MYNSLVSFPASSGQWARLQREIFDTFKDFSLEMIGKDNFPIYDCRYNENKDFIIDLALAGYEKNQISVELVDQSSLIVKGEGNTSVSSDFYCVRNISNKSFQKNFRLSHEVEIKSVTYSNGILSITMSILGQKEKRKIFKPD